MLGGKQCSICLHVLRAWAGTHIKSHESSNKHKEAIFRREVRPPSQLPSARITSLLTHCSDTGVAGLILSGSV